MKTLRYLLTFIALLVALNALATQLPDDIEPGGGVNEIQLPLTKESAAELIRVEKKGKVLSVDKKKNKGKGKGKDIFKIKVLHDNGKIKNYQLDPKTGRPPQ